jgi:hypothetical protein
MARNVRMAHNRGNKAKAPRTARIARGIIIIIMVARFVYEFDIDYIMSICSHECLHLSL